MTNRIIVTLFTMVALCLGSSTLVKSARVTEVRSSNINLTQITSGPFRDGLYLGKLAAKQGAAPHITTGRWATEADRVRFTAGFQHGYAEEGLHHASLAPSTGN